ncbi:YncE family protein [bacterium]|nr:YncE family protein [bacterium]
MGHPVTRALSGLLALAVWAVAGCGGGSRGIAGVQERFAGPTRVAVQPNVLDPYGHYLFIANNQGGTITVVNAKKYTVLSAHTNEVDDTDVVRVGRAPYDIALTPAGDRLFVTDTWRDNVRVVSGWAGRRPDVFDVKVVFDDEGRRGLRYDIRVDELPLVVRAGEIELPARLPEEGEPLRAFVTDPDGARLFVLDADAGEVIGEAALSGTPAGLALSDAGDRVFVTTREGDLLFVNPDTPAQIVNATIELGGAPGAMAIGREQSELYVLNNDPPRVHVVRLGARPEVVEEVELPSAPNSLARTGDGRDVWISANDGFVYVLDTDTRRICNSWGGRVFFDDEWPPSNPALERIEVRDCLVATERWVLTYHLPEDEWTVRGTQSGLQIARAQSDQFYVTDGGELGFSIRENEYHASDGDTFYFESNVGVAPIRVGLVPDGIAMTPFYKNADFDIVFIANTGTHNLSILYTEEIQRIGVIP